MRVAYYSSTASTLTVRIQQEHVGTCGGVGAGMRPRKQGRGSLSFATNQLYNDAFLRIESTPMRSPSIPRRRLQ